MTPERYQQVKSAFERTLEQPPEGRLTFLLEHCEGDTSLLEQVQALISADQNQAFALDKPAVGTEFRLRTTWLANTATRHSR